MYVYRLLEILFKKKELLEIGKFNYIFHLVPSHGLEPRTY
jgi:hypothetical protein